MLERRLCERLAFGPHVVQARARVPGKRVEQRVVGTRIVGQKGEIIRK